MTAVLAEGMRKRLRLNRDAVLIQDRSEFRLTLGPVTLGAGKLPDWMAALLHRLEDEDVPEEELQAAALAGGGPAGLFRWVESVRRLDAGGMLARRVTMADEHVSTIRPAGTGPSDRPVAFDPSARQRLSRLAVIRVQDGVLIAAHPSSHLVVELGPAAVQVISQLTGWTSWQQISEHGSAPVGEVTRAVLDQLARAAVTDQTTGSADSEPEPAAAQQWNPFDWWLHSRSRNPRIVTGWGGSYPGRGRFDRLPALPAGFSGRQIVLPVPDLEAGRTGGESLTSVMERRRSVREHDDDRPITLAQLAELLYRACRTRAVVPTSSGSPADSDEIVDRPYPAGGALHELEIYPVVRRCEGLDPAMWHYRSADHRLEWVSGPGEAVDQLLWAAQSASTMSAQPQVLLVISARFGRLMFKYETIAYALTLKHVGVLLQSLYLVATEMGLAPTALGSGDAAAFAAATGLDRMAEGSVGEFVLGSLPATLSPGLLNTWKG